MAEPATTKGLLKRIPPWGWAIGAGGILGLGYTLYRQRRTPDAQAPPAGESASDFYGEYDLAAQPSPGGAYYPSTPIIAEPAETVGAVGQTALETAIGGITGVIENLPALIAATPQPQQSEQMDFAGIITALQPLFPTAPAPGAAPPPTVPNPPAATPPKGVTILGKTFPNATDYKERSHPGRGREFDVYFPKRVERWFTEEKPVGGTFGNAQPITQRTWKKISTRNR